MKQLFLLIVCYLAFLQVNAQYTEIINSKRPGFSESPYGVGTNVFQVESGFFYRKNQIAKTFDIDNSYGANVFLRYGKFSEKLEINLDFAYQKDRIVFHNILNSYSNVSGISKLTFGAKYLIHNQKYTDKSKEIHSWKKRTSFDKKRLIPSVGAYVGVNTNFLSPYYKEEGISLKGAILLQNDISSRFVVLTNLYADKIMQDMEYGYILTATYAVNLKWSIFGENQGIRKKIENNEMQFGVGTAYLFNNNVQFDFAARTTFAGKSNDIYLALGGSWRLDRHVKETKSEDVLKGEKKGSFFSRLFKKKRGRTPKTRKIKAKKRKIKEKKTKRKRKKRKRVKKAKKGTPSFYDEDKKSKKKKRKRKRKNKE